MNNKFFKYLVLIPIIIHLIVARYVPEIVPIRYDINGQVQATGSINFYLGISFIPLIVLIISQLYRMKSKISLNKYMEKSINACIVCFTVIIVLVNLSLLTEGISNAQLILIVVDLLLIYVGNIMNKLEQNRMVGILFPATLKNVEVWNRVHFIAGRITVLVGLIGLILSIVNYPRLVANLVFLGLSVLVFGITMFIYSNSLLKKIESKEKTCNTNAKI